MGPRMTTDEGSLRFRCAVPPGTTVAVARSTAFPDLYEVLGAPRDAAPEGIEDAYRRRVRELERDDVAEDEAEQRYRELSHAYAVLSKPRSRLLYDRIAHRAPPGGSPPDDVELPEPLAEASSDEDDYLAGWIFGEDQLRFVEREPPAQRFMRYLATAALLVAIVFVVLILLG
jgi:curved DNA-binding protein CbpA